MILEIVFKDYYYCNCRSPFIYVHVFTVLNSLLVLGQSCALGHYPSQNWDHSVTWISYASHCDGFLSLANLLVATEFHPGFFACALDPCECTTLAHALFTCTGVSITLGTFRGIESVVLFGTGTSVLHAPSFFTCA